jgi:hypothetical protein
MQANASDTQPTNPLNSSGTQLVKRKVRFNEETPNSDDDCIMSDAVSVCEGVTPSNLATTEAMRKFKISSKNSSNKNKKLRKELVDANKRIEELTNSNSMSQTNKNLLNNAVNTAIQNERASGLKTSAAEITKAKFAMEKVHVADLQRKTKEYWESDTINGKLLDKIKSATNELRYTEMFGNSSSRGVPFCVVSQLPIMPVERVFALVSDCACNNMVKFSHGARYMKDFEMGKDVYCLTCRRRVSNVVATTAKKAELDFAWRTMQGLTKCDDEQRVVDRCIQQMEDKAKSQTAQDTQVFRSFINTLVKSAPKT